MKTTKRIAFLMLLVSLICCRQKSSDNTARPNLAETQIHFLDKLQQAEGLIKGDQNGSANRSQIILQLDNYLVDSVRQFKGWQFKVDTIKSVTLSGTPSYRVDLSCPVTGDSTKVGEGVQYVNFHFTVPKDPAEEDLAELEKVTSMLSPGDIVEMNGVIFMTDSTMEIITLTDYFDPTKSKTLYLIPVKLQKKSN